MKRSLLSTPCSAVLVLVAAAFLPACGGSQPSEPATPPPPPPVAAPAPPPVAATPPAAPPPAAAEAPPPAAPPEHHMGHGHGMAAMLTASLTAIELKPEQKTVVDGVQADFEKLGEQHVEPGKKLADDIADGVAAGKIDHAKTDADVRAIVKAVEGTEPGIQDAFNRLHKTLDPEQRKKLIEAMREKGKEMREHGMGGEHEHGEHEHGEHEHGEHEHGEHEHGEHGKGPGEHGPGPGGPGMKPGEEHEGGRGHGGMEGHMMEKLADDLALTPEQREKLHTKLEAQMKAKEATMKAKMAAGEKHMMAIGDAFETDKFDAKKVGVGTQAPEMAKGMATERVTFAETVLSVLTPEQRTKFAAQVKEHAGDAD